MRSKEELGKWQGFGMTTGRMGMQLTEIGKTLEGIDFVGGIKSSFLSLLRVRYQVGHLRY